MAKNWSYWNELGGTGYTSDQIAQARRQAEKNVATTWQGIGRDPAAERLPTRWKDADQGERDELFQATLARLYGSGTAGAGETPIEATRRDLEGAGRFSQQSSERLAGLQLAQAYADTDPLIGPVRNAAIDYVGGLRPDTYTSGAVADETALARSQAQQQDVRQQGMDAIRQLSAIARGENSAVDAEARRQREQLGASIASDLASMPAASEASIRAALMARSAGEADLGARTAVARSQEQSDAIKMLAAAAQAQQGADQQQQAMDLQELQARMQRQAASDSLAQWLYSVGTGGTSTTQSAFASQPAPAYATPGDMNPYVRFGLGLTSGIVAQGAGALL